ncbi:MAG: hypothetical protein ABIP02_03755 [Arenimonas sp.]
MQKLFIGIFIIGFVLICDFALAKERLQKKHGQLQPCCQRISKSGLCV